MEIIIRPSREVEISILKYGDVCKSASGRILMKVAGGNYVKDDDPTFDTTIIDLEEGYVDRISHKAMVTPIKLVAREE